MPDSFTKLDILNAIAKGSASLSSRKEEINRLNVFPVPDGDTGTNMSLTLESVVSNLRGLSADPSGADIRKAITTGALMGARGNSGVITSQILRGLSEGYPENAQFNTDSIAQAFSKAAGVAFQAVRKPVEGTILTVLRDVAGAAQKASQTGLNTQEAMEVIVSEAYASVERTPELLPVLKENNVVDAGGFGLAILIDGIFSSLLGNSDMVGSALHIGVTAPKVEIEQVDDWEGSEYRYCNEFLVDSDTLDPEEALDFLSTMGDCELCVGSAPKFKVHVHSNHPDQVLKYFLDRGQIFEVFIHNMDLQSQDRANKIALEEGDATGAEKPKEQKPLGFVAVAPGDGNAAILKSLGVDVVVSGGQTMNPSTKDLYDAIEKVPAESVIVLPNNSNIVMAANSACELTKKPCAVVPTKSVPQSFTAMFSVNPDASLEENVEAMGEAILTVRTGEVTTAIKASRDSKKNKIRKGDIIGIADGSIDAVGKTVEGVVMDLLKEMDAQDFDTITLLAGKDYDDDSLAALAEDIETAYPDIEVDAQRGGQPLYPVVFSVE